MAAINSTSTGSAPKHSITKEERKVIFASSLGTVFEWYDFYLYGSLAAIIAKHFFAGVNETTSFIFALLAFAAGFAVRPFGAIVFGRLGDMIGRKHTFLITIVIMGVSTAVVGLLPSYATIGVAAPVILITLRLLQGLALGGEYGGAATYVAEHAPKGKRGFFTAWIQTTATMGLFLSLLVILACRTALGTEAFEAWGWRIPFLLSIVLLAVSVYIRLQLNESPVFLKMKAEGKQSKAPLTESFARWDNLKVVIMSLLGGTAGQAVVWYTGQFYALFFLLQTLKIDPQTANLLIAGSLLIGTPFFIIFGSLSDPVGKAKFTSSCDVAKSLLAKRAIPYQNQHAEPGSLTQIQIGERQVPSFDGSSLASAEFKLRNDAFTATLGAALKEAGYPEKADPNKTNYPMVLLLLTILVIYVTMVYGPIAAWLVELFPARIRYTSMSLPYHIGNGWFGGFLPTVAFAMVAATGDIYYGLWYPIIIALMTAVLGILFLPETKDRDIT